MGGGLLFYGVYQTYSYVNDKFYEFMCEELW